MRRLLCMAVWLVVQSAAAREYPSKPIRLIVPFSAGSGSDYVGRLVGQKLSEQMSSGGRKSSRRPPRSSAPRSRPRRPPTATRCCSPIRGFTINPAFYKNTKYDPLKDSEPITVVAETPYLGGEPVVAVLPAA